ncbi:hypothetical protein A5659_13335 [Mycobacterium sp. 1165196.3]|nr:hypothetical protein A5659_13335 [Mycobacterium sp. 1165196.3]OBK98778.1 hypothetical protein A5646_23080 [Mycobacterium sp. 1245499.0]
MPALFPAGYHGPLVVALDSNILIDMQQHGNTLLDGGAPHVGELYQVELLALGSVLDVWLMRDIRFIATPRSRTDGRRGTDHVLAKRERAIDALGETLAFQYSDWTVVAPADFEDLHEYGTIDGLPEGADRDLVGEAQSVGAHVFLTRDRAVLGRAVVDGRALGVMSPTALLDQLVSAGVQPFAGGLCQDVACPYRRSSVLAPDTGKWSSLFSIFEDE